MGKACPFAIQNLIKIEISKMTGLRDTLVDDSKIGPLANLVLFFSLACLMFVFSRTSIA